MICTAARSTVIKIMSWEQNAERRENKTFFLFFFGRFEKWSGELEFDFIWLQKRLLILANVVKYYKSSSVFCRQLCVIFHICISNVPTLSPSVWQTVHFLLLFCSLYCLLLFQPVRFSLALLVFDISFIHSYKLTGKPPDLTTPTPVKPHA